MQKQIFMANFRTETGSINWKKFLTQWEVLLVGLLIIINIVNSSISPFYFSVDGLLNATMSFLDKTFIVFPMAMVILIGEIDISVASTVALSSVVMGMAYNGGHGVPMVVAILICLAVGTLCGFINGMILTRFPELSSMIVTLATLTIYRGIAEILLTDKSAGNFPDWFQYFGWGYVGPIPFILICFVICVILFSFLLNKTRFGRRIYAIGGNRTASRFSGIRVDRFRIIIFTLAGFMASITALFLTSRMSSTRPNIALNYELDVIAMVVLGGISTAGGKGKLTGALLAIFVIGLLRYGLGLKNIEAQVLLIIIGLMLVFSVLIPNLMAKRRSGPSASKQASRPTAPKA
jgi:rhamnose transport system permease protein